jgi:hypothetical protein
MTAYNHMSLFVIPRLDRGIYFKNIKLKQMDARLHGHDGVAGFFDYALNPAFVLFWTPVNTLLLKTRST